MKQNLIHDLSTKLVILAHGKLPKNCSSIELKLVSDIRYDAVEELWLAYEEEYYEQSST